MKIYFLLIGLILSYNHSYVLCQQPEYIKGKVINSKTSEAVPYATVYLKNSRIGIYTNSNGDFRILNNPGFQTDSLIISCIGFHRLSLAFNNLNASGLNNLKILPDVYSLKEVTINARKKKISPEIIISRAFRDIKKNNPVEPFSYVSYYRDYQKDSSNYFNLNEAIIQTLDKGFAFPPDSGRHRLLEFKKNTDFIRNNISPYYDLPETDHSEESFKRIPHAMVGDQYGNEFFILLAHDSFRHFNKRSFSFVDTLTRNFIKNHWFSTPVGVYDGGALLYKIGFTAKEKLTQDIFQGFIYIQPDDYSIHKLEYSGSYLDPEKKRKEIFNIRLEYGREPSVNSRMCLKYISFSNTFTIPDSSDTDFFKIIKSDWWNFRFTSMTFPSTIILAEFNRKVDPVSGRRKENYNILLGKRQAKIADIKVDGINVFITIRNDHFKKNEYDSTFISYKNLKDIDGNILNKKRESEFRQFRELFVQEYNKLVEFQNDCLIESMPLDKNCISISGDTGRFWMNTPLREEESVE